MSRDAEQRLRIERKLMRQSAAHHIRREAELEQRLADAMSLAKRTRCKCRCCKSLRALLAELESAP